jgi:hypothetical protein
MYMYRQWKAVLTKQKVKMNEINQYQQKTKKKIDKQKETSGAKARNEVKVRHHHHHHHNNNNYYNNTKKNTYIQKRNEQF